MSETKLTEHKVTKWVTFNYYGDAWTAILWDSPPGNMTSYRIEIPVPEAELRESIPVDISTHSEPHVHIQKLSGELRNVRKKDE